MTADCTPARIALARLRRGFNLVEAAIVLGVIGLVIGGIWVVASTVTENQRLNQAVTGVESMVRQYRNIYAGQGPASIQWGASWVNTNLFTLPAGWTRGGYPTNPWGSGVYIDTGGGNMGGCCGTNPDIEFYFYNVPRARCINLAMGLSKLPNYYDTPYTLTTANTLCNQAVMPQVAFRYRIF